ncbi:uncharacterized protein THITE_2107972 [Thermothielavioides terrestris NRRL 8126]|uniref:Uncharacterized protein n=1 Tax=Thermothielavioides terrestris (strain ATCC 38088 / NRRL 8126) TaxID=578455 RepID=G2QWU0_THETT|nr:uncharacterized protein THITE_2107972 [Thermothielavioides terrestris NRRL 8126]AEO63104.1 hypothetical protein THITE_2107972 [Thermothielavioides terrestris NRRL 8126]
MEELTRDFDLMRIDCDADSIEDGSEAGQPGADRPNLGFPAFPLSAECFKGLRNVFQLFLPAGFQHADGQLTGPGTARLADGAGLRQSSPPSPSTNTIASRSPSLPQQGSGSASGTSLPTLIFQPVYIAGNVQVSFNGSSHSQ